MNYTRETLGQAIRNCADDIMEDNDIRRGINVGNGMEISLKLVDDNDGDKYRIPGKIIQITLVDSATMKIVKGTQPLHVRDDSSFSRLAEYFAYKLGIED